MKTIERDVSLASSWVLLPPGKLALCRFPADHIPEGARLASAVELLAANQGKPFPWGSMPSPERKNRMWNEEQIGCGGLYHDRWFKTSDGRFGGADNVPKEGPGRFRRCMLLDGGDAEGLPEGNEGYALVKPVDRRNADIYRKVQFHSVQHVAGDGGAIIVSPMNDGGIIYVGFVGRCQTCPNPEQVSFEQLKHAVPGYNFQLYPEWENWSLEAVVA
jgi:hypothetical protein